MTPDEGLFNGAVASGTFVAEYLSDVDEDQIQPNGVDLRVDNILWVDRAGTATFDADDEYDKPPRVDVPKDNDGYWRLGGSTHIVEYDHKIEIPEGYVGYVVPRSRLMRSGMDLVSALWDQGYEGRGEGLIKSGNTTARIEEGATVGQMVFVEADVPPDETYDGQHQGEGL